MSSTIFKWLWNRRGTKIPKRILIIGAGQAGQSLAETLRNEGYKGRLIMVGEEPSAPYQRPPLSKAYLLGTSGQERLQFQSDEFYVEQDIETHWGVRVDKIDRAAKTATLSNGLTIAYDKLALTTGSRARALPDETGGGLDGVYLLRNLAHVDAMATEFEPGRALVIIGGGYIGLEIAAVARTRGLDVTIIEAAPRLLARVAATQTASYFERLHQNNGVVIMTGTGVARLESGGGQAGHPGETGQVARVDRVILDDGTQLPADFVIAGIGVMPNIELAEAANLTIDNGICVDAQCRASDRNIFAAGDCTSLPLCDHAGLARRVRLESVQNAVNQASIAAKAMLGQDVSYCPIPWFWSDQYDVKLQIAGLSQGFDTAIVRPGKRENAQSVWYFAGKYLLAVDAMNDPRGYMTGKRLLEQMGRTGRSPDPDMVADPSSDLMALLDKA